MNRHHANRGFTLVELFVVIAVALIAIAAALPAFTAMTASSNRSLAENTLQVAVTMARDVVMQSSRGTDGAAVFLYDAANKRMRIVAAEYVGTITDTVDGNANLTIERDVFAPVLVGETTELPPNWMVRGFVPARFTTTAGGPGFGYDWYDSDLYATGNAWRRGHWVFPEDGFYDVTGSPTSARPVGRTPRQSFMIRFDGRTGQIRRDGRESLLIDPRPSSLNRQADLGGYGVTAGSRNDPGAWLRVDWAENLVSWGRRVVSEPDLNGNGLPYEVNDERLRRALIGNQSLDTVLVSDVSRVALYDERDLASALGASQMSRRGGGKDTGSLYEAYDATSGNIAIDYEGLFTGNSAFSASSAGQANLRDSIDRWIDGDTNRVGTATNFVLGNGVLFEGPESLGGADEPKALRYLVDPYSGELTEVAR
ncbi:MAG: prepilin-type N-terminal cleavage/methylation domain-containing protein [Phycisphaerales bacterium]|nr:prepilin-type N-terminal cleavage/methylation domain-containing protein [Phycisphaerales bacterium]